MRQRRPLEHVRVSQFNGEAIEKAPSISSEESYSGGVVDRRCSPQHNTSAHGP